AKKHTTAQPRKSLSLASATITRFGIEGFDLLEGRGKVTTKSTDIKDVGLEIASRGENAFKQVHLSIKGTGLTGRLTGPGKYAIDLGHVESLSGTYADNDTAVKSFSARDITGNVEIGPDYVHLLDINAGPVKFGRTEYSDAGGNKVGLDGVDISA